MSIRKELARLGAAIVVVEVLKAVNAYVQTGSGAENVQAAAAEKSKKIADYAKKTNEANRLINDESNRLITWSLSIIGGSILTIISTSYDRPTGFILYGYFLFSVGWICSGLSIYYGELVTRIYIAGTTADTSKLDPIKQVGLEADKAFSAQIKWFRYGILSFAVWLTAFLVWFILIKKG